MPRHRRSDAPAIEELSAEQPQDRKTAANEPLGQDFLLGQPSVERDANGNVQRLAKYINYEGKYFSPLEILARFDIDFSEDITNIENISNSEMKSRLLDLVSTLRASADAIEAKIGSAQPDEALNVISPAPGSLASEIRKHVFQAFRLTANTLGRASHSSVLEDTRSMVHRLISANQVAMYSPARGGKLAQDPEDWIKTALVPRLDPDMTSSSKREQIPVFNLSVYQDDGTMPRLKRFYDSLSYWRRNRLRTDESAATLVAARAYSRKTRA